MNVMKKLNRQFKQIFGDKKIDLVCDKATEFDRGLIKIKSSTIIRRYKKENRGTNV